MKSKKLTPEQKDHIDELYMQAIEMAQRIPDIRERTAEIATWQSARQFHLKMTTHAENNAWVLQLLEALKKRTPDSSNSQDPFDQIRTDIPGFQSVGGH